MGLSVLEKLAGEEEATVLEVVAETTDTIGPDEEAAPEAKGAGPGYPLFVSLIITTFIAYRLVMDTLTETWGRAVRATHKAAAAIKTLAQRVFDWVSSPIWDGLDKAREYIDSNGLAKSLAAFLWVLVRKTTTLSLVLAVVVIWSLIWSAFGFTGTWQLLVKAGFISAVFLTYLAVEFT